MKLVVFNEKEIESFRKSGVIKYGIVGFSDTYWFDTILCVSLYKY